MFRSSWVFLGDGVTTGARRTSTRAAGRASEASGPAGVSGILTSLRAEVYRGLPYDVNSSNQQRLYGLHAGIRVAWIHFDEALRLPMGQRERAMCRRDDLEALGDVRNRDRPEVFLERDRHRLIHFIKQERRRAVQSPRLHILHELVHRPWPKVVDAGMILRLFGEIRNVLQDVCQSIEADDPLLSTRHLGHHLANDHAEVHESVLGIIERRAARRSRLGRHQEGGCPVPAHLGLDLGRRILREGLRIFVIRGIERIDESRPASPGTGIGAQDIDQRGLPAAVWPEEDVDALLELKGLPAYPRQLDWEPIHDGYAVDHETS